jgi:hypothetical protein
MVVKLYLGAVGLFNLEKIIQEFWIENRNLIRINFPDENSIKESLLPALKYFKTNTNGTQFGSDIKMRSMISDLFVLDSPNLTVCRSKLLCPISSIEDSGRFYRIDEKFTKAAQNIFLPNELELHFSILPMHDYFLTLCKANPSLAEKLKKLNHTLLSWNVILKQVSNLMPNSKIIVWDMEGGDLILDEMLSNLFDVGDDDSIIWPNPLDKTQGGGIELMPPEWQERHDEEYGRDLFKLATVNNITVMTAMATEVPHSMGEADGNER